jgi:ABC-2 type transport system ATP-binding protein
MTVNRAIEISAVSKSYVGFRLQELSLAVPAGSILGLIGKNGAGKTTLFQCILNLIHRNSGSVRLHGLDADVSGERIRLHLGYVPERLVFYEWMSVATALDFTSGFYGNWDSGRCRDLLCRYSLDPDKRIRALSAGMRKKLALIQALAIRPRALILDEPTVGLDPEMKFHFLRDVRALVDAGEIEAAIISSHNLDEVEQLVDAIAILKSGVLGLHESKCSFLESWRKVVFRPPTGSGWRSACPMPVHQLAADRYMIVTKGETASLTRTLGNLGAAAIEVLRPNLQEIFLQVA